jgi:S1-C subfamily serine protease
MRPVERTLGGYVLGDVIVGIGDQKVTSYDELYNALDGKKPGERVKVRLARGGPGGKVEEVELALEVVE